MKKYVLFICLIFSQTNNGIYSDSSVPMIVRSGSYDNPPKVFLDSEGKPAGIFPDLLNFIAEKENWLIEYSHGTWEDCLDNLGSGKIDIMVDMAYSLSRNLIYDFNNEAVLINWAVIYSLPELEINSFLDLDGKSLAVMRGSIHTDGEEGIISQIQGFNLSADFIDFSDYEQVFEALDQKKADAGVTNRIFGALYDSYYNIKKTPVIFNPRHLKFAFPKDAVKNPKLIAAIDKTLSPMKKDKNSQLYKILDYYLSGIPENMYLKEFIPYQKSPLTEDEKKWIEEHPIIRMGVDPEFYPFEFINDKGEYCGISSEYVAILNERLGLNIRLVDGLTWDQAVEAAENRQIDILPCLGKTLDRSSYLSFSMPYLNFHRVIITKIDYPFISGINDIKGRKIGVQENTSHAGYMAENYPDISPVYFDSLKNALISLSNGTIDAFVGNIASSTYWIRKMNLLNLKVAAPVYPGLDSLHFGVRDDWPELAGIINKGLQSIDAKKADEIQKKWIQIDYQLGVSKQIIRKYFWQILTALIVAAAVVILWIRSLKKQIKLRQSAEKKLEDYAGELEIKINERTEELVEKQRDLETSLKDKEVLLHEVHHRVKNNIQIIISLLNLSARNSEKGIKEDVISANINRIMVMSFIYGALIRHPEMSKLSVKELINDIILRLTGIFDNTSCKIIKEYADFKLDINIMICLGIIINELLTNSLSHGFRQGKAGEIIIKMTKNNNRIEFSYMEPASNFAGKIDLDNPDSLGLLIIKTMIYQINGKLTYSIDDELSVFDIEFNADQE